MYSTYITSSAAGNDRRIVRETVKLIIVISFLVHRSINRPAILVWNLI